ncbi:metallophosphoesterase family protein [Bacillus massiliigorillae]|uniref:metallophosphoesterase family protein n=1 Tax=Bacillus massiliigorillae TaxID=1243664 RepID=UPI0003AA82AE|nr:DNA repair exonuclease [Bacillus massiliigorillae]
MKEITFIHAADLHLDSPFSGLKHISDNVLQEMKDATFVAFQKIVQEAIKRKVDFVLLAGDLYDGENRNLHTQVRFRKEMEKLKQYDIDVYIIHGNHDHLSGKWISIAQPSNVHVFGSEYEVKTFTKADITVHIYGYSYPEQHVKWRIIDEYCKQEGADYHIGMLHGNLEGQSEHGQYAPFSLDELQSKDFDYWALGHIHKRQELLLSPPIIYPGNIQGRHKKEAGIKGCYYVKLADKHADLEFVPTSQIVWDTLAITINQEDDFDAVLANCQTALEQIRSNIYRFFVCLQFINHNQSLQVEEFSNELVEILQEEEKHEVNFVYPYAYTVDYGSVNKAVNQPLMELIQSFEWSEQDVNEAIQPLFKHALGRKFLTSLSAEEKAELIKEAEQLLTSQLCKGGGE